MVYINYFIILFVTHCAITLTIADKIKRKAEFSNYDGLENDYYDSSYEDVNEIKNDQPNSNLPEVKTTTSTTQSAQTSTATTSATTVTTQSLSLLECTNRCQTTNEYNPVCGSDRLSYSNIAKLNCAVNCGKDVIFLRAGLCVPRPG